MNWFNAPTSISRSPEYIGSDPVQRATWFSLIMYCVSQENAGVIRDSKTWKDRRWQQTAGVTSEEVEMECDLFWWDCDDLHVAFYPIDSEGEVNRRRETARVNGRLGGRPRRKPTGKNLETNVGYLVSETQEPTAETSVTGLEEPNNQKDKIREEKIREDNEREGEYTPPPLCTIEQARSAASMNRMTDEEADHWWHTRNASGWTKGTTSGGAPRKITSWQSDMATSVQWVRESLAKHKQASAAKNHQAKLEWEQ